MRVSRQPAHSAPSAGGIIVADIGPFTEIGLAQDHAAIGADIRDQWRIAASVVFRQRERACGGGPFAGFDIVFDENNVAVEQTLAAKLSRLLCRIFGVDNNRTDLRTLIVVVLDSLGVSFSFRWRISNCGRCKWRVYAGECRAQYYCFSHAAHTATHRARCKRRQKLPLTLKRKIGPTRDLRSSVESSMPSLRGPS